MRQGIFKESEVVSVDTLYRYAEEGKINLKAIDLPEKVMRKNKPKKHHRVNKRLKGKSIEKSDRRRSMRRKSSGTGKLIV